jgi:hypothetical protein
MEGVPTSQTGSAGETLRGARWDQILGAQLEEREFEQCMVAITTIALLLLMIITMTR